MKLIVVVLTCVICRRTLSSSDSSSSGSETDSSVSKEVSTAVDPKYFSPQPKINGTNGNKSEILQYMEDALTTQRSVEEFEFSTSGFVPDKPIVKKLGVEGPFFDLLTGICKTLLNSTRTTFLRPYLKVLSPCLKPPNDADYFIRRTLKKFRKCTRMLARLNGKILKHYVRHFLKFLQDIRPMKKEFYNVMNGLYSIWVDNKFDDYLFILKGFEPIGMQGIRYCTRKLFGKYVFGAFRRLNKQKKWDISQKLRSAVMEYLEDTNSTRALFFPIFWQNTE